MDQRLGIVAYSDYICPWCYIGLRRIERLEREFPVDVEWRPFELHPETPRSGFDLSARLGGLPRARAYAENIVALAAESELTIRMPRAVANSHLALEAAEFAREHGGFDRVHAALFAAYFQDGRDIGDAAVLGEVAGACGIDSEGLRSGARGGPVCGGGRPGHRRGPGGRGGEHADVRLRRRVPPDRGAGVRRLLQRDEPPAGKTNYETNARLASNRAT